MWCIKNNLEKLLMDRLRQWNDKYKFYLNLRGLIFSYTFNRTQNIFRDMLPLLTDIEHCYFAFQTYLVILFFWL